MRKGNISLDQAIYGHQRSEFDLLLGATGHLYYCDSELACLCPLL